MKNIRYYIDLLYEGFSEAQTEFAAASDPNQATDAIKQYRELVNRNQVSGNERNIDYWRKQGWEKFLQFVTSKAATPSATQVKRGKVPGEGIVLQGIGDDKWHIVIPLDKQRSCFHGTFQGKVVTWCTTKANQGYFEKYFYDKEVTLIYCFNKETGGSWAIAAHKDTDQIEMFDVYDASINETEFKAQTGLNPIEIVKKAFGPAHQPAIQKSRDTWKESVKRAHDLLDFEVDRAGSRSENLEKELIFNKDGNLCAEYINKLSGNQKLQVDGIPIPIQIAAVVYEPGMYLLIKNPLAPVMLAAVFENPLTLRHIPLDTPTYKKLAITALTRAPSDVLEYGIIPKNYLLSNIDVCMAAVTSYGPSIESLPEEVQSNKEIQLAAVTNEGFALANIPKEDVNPTLCMVAVKQNGKVLRVVPFRFRLYYADICLEAVKQNEEAMKHVPSELHDHNIVKYNLVCMEAVSKKGEVLRFIPIEYRTVPICVAAVKQYQPAIIHVPRQIKDEVTRLAAKTDESVVRMKKLAGI